MKKLLIFGFILALFGCTTYNITTIDSGNSVYVGHYTEKWEIRDKNSPYRKK